jgi:multiple sugar transport system ATP-binding protein
VRVPRLKIEGLCKTFPGRSGRTGRADGVKALDSFSLEIREREFVTVVGPSGCGKTTLLRILAGLDDATGGTVALDGRTLDGLPPRDRDMAIMFQNYALFPHLTVAENMAFGLKLRKTPRAEAAAMVKDAAKMLGIEALLGRYPSEMSGGQRQRAALGRAILRRPKVFLFDEPLSNLDAKMRAQMRVEIARLHQRLESSMIFVTHDQIEAMTMGDRVVVLKDGVIQQAADPDTLYREPANAFVASFIGSPGMNLFPGRIAADKGRPAFVHPLFTWILPESLRIRIGAYAEKPIVFGVRPEDIGSAEARRAEGCPMMKAEIGVVERLGGQACLYLQNGEHAFAARPDDALGCHAGDAVELPVFAPNGRFFDPVSGAAIV